MSELLAAYSKATERRGAAAVFRAQEFALICQAVDGGLETWCPGLSIWGDEIKMWP